MSALVLYRTGDDGEFRTMEAGRITVGDLVESVDSTSRLLEITIEQARVSDGLVFARGEE